MRISILAYGSRGDVQPYLALALALARNGHSVRLAAPAMFRDFAEEYIRSTLECGDRVEFFPLPGDPARLMGAAAAPSKATALLPNSLRTGFTVARFVMPIIPELVREIRRCCEGAELVIHTLLTAIIGHQIAREMGSKDISALIFPVLTPTTEFPNGLFAPWPGWTKRLGRKAANFGPQYNYLTHREFNRVFWHGNRRVLRWLQKKSVNILPLEEWPFDTCCEFAPKAAPENAAPVIYSFSSHALPCLGDAALQQRMTGYWYLDALPGWQPPPALERFLENGPPPVFIGFGSMIPHKAERLVQAAINALRNTEQRGILLQGWSGVNTANLPEWIFPIEQAPLEWLFPRVAAAVHHGGIGTTSGVLRAGIPQTITPFAFEQAFWGRQMYRLGLGPEPIHNSQITQERLTGAIRRMLDDDRMREQAAQVGEKIRQENGLQNAVQMIEAFAARRSDQLIEEHARHKSS